MLRRIFSIIILISTTILPQTEYVRVDNPVYIFLERMDALHFVSGYNKFEIPKTRNEIASYLNKVKLNTALLDEGDKNNLLDFENEFELELTNSLNNAQSIIGDGRYDLFSQNEKYLFMYLKPGKANLFINLLAEGEIISSKIDENKYLSSVGIMGGEIRGTFLNKFGFLIRGTNGSVFGDREAALAREDVRYNYKFNSLPDESFFDETEGYITADFDLVKFKFGRDRMNIGYGTVKSILGSSSPLFDYLSLKINYNFFSYSFFHGKLLGRNYYDPDSISGGSEFIEDKYIAYHRVGFDLSENADFGIGEIVIYGNRSIDFSYLNPFTFYKSVEHANRDRDNAMLFLDFNNNSIKGLNLYSTLLIDDISYGKLGSGWWGNQTIFTAGFFSSNLYNIIPLDVRFDYLRIEPYTFTHRLIRNNYTNYSFNLSSVLQPNSELFNAQMSYRINHRLEARAGFQYTIHGANPVDDNGNVLKNVGGDISLGHRTFDSETTVFLDGELEYKREFTFSLIYEPVNQIKFLINFNFMNESLQKAVSIKTLNTFFRLDIKI